MRTVDPLTVGSERSSLTMTSTNRTVSERADVDDPWNGPQMNGVGVFMVLVGVVEQVDHADPAGG